MARGRSRRKRSRGTSERDAPIARTRKSTMTAEHIDFETAELEASRLLQHIRQLPSANVGLHARHSDSKPSTLEAFAAGKSALLGIDMDTAAQDNIDFNSSLRRSFDARSSRWASPLSPAQHQTDIEYTTTQREKPISSQRSQQLKQWGENEAQKVDALIDAALEAQTQALAPLTGIQFGAAVETRGGFVYTGCNIESPNTSNDISAARMALLKAITEGKTSFNRIALTWNEPSASGYPSPDGAVRQFMADYGDFEVILVKNDGCRSVETTTTFSLLPLANHSLNQSLNGTLKSTTRGQSPVSRVFQSRSKSPIRPTSGAAFDRALSTQVTRSENQNSTKFQYPNRPVCDWGVGQVLSWLDKECNLPSYQSTFRECSVDGSMLLQLTVQDMQDLLGVVHPLHLQKLMKSLENLKQREILEYGLATGNLEEYLAVVEQDRIQLICDLKAAFDTQLRTAHENANDSGVEVSSDKSSLDVPSIAAVVERVNLIVSTTTMHEWIETFGEGVNPTSLTFPQLVQAITSHLQKQANVDTTISSIQPNARVHLVKGGRHLSLPPNALYEKWKETQSRHDPRVQGSGVHRWQTSTLGQHGDNRSRIERWGSGTESDDTECDEFSGHRNKRFLLRHTGKRGKPKFQLAMLSGAEFSKLKRLFSRADIEEVGEVTCDAAAKALCTTGLHIKPAHVGQYLRLQGLSTQSGLDFYEFSRLYAFVVAQSSSVVGTDVFSDGGSEYDGEFQITTYRNHDHQRARSHSPRRSRPSTQQWWNDSSDDEESMFTSSSSSSVVSIERHASRSKWSRPRYETSSRKHKRRAKSSRQSTRKAHSRSSRFEVSSSSDNESSSESDWGGSQHPDSLNKACKRYSKLPRAVQRRLKTVFDRYSGEFSSKVNVEQIPKMMSKLGLKLSTKAISRYIKRRKIPHYCSKGEYIQCFIDLSSHSSSSSSESELDSPTKQTRRSRSMKHSALSSDSEPESEYRRGDQVEARFGGKSRFYKGEIVRVNRDRTYDIDYVDGDKERGVQASFIRPLEPKSSPRSRSRCARDMESEVEGFSRGDQVEARFGGKSRYYKGEIVRVNRDGTYDIDYVDGDKERGVKASFIRSLEPKSSPRSRSRGARDMDSEAEGFTRGDKVEARFGGKSRYYKGEIVRVNRDGTYDIDYVDGDKERGVKASFIRSLEPKSSPRSKSRGARDMDSEAEGFSRGDQVEARFGGKSRYYKGEIVRANRDGTYDIDYVDGDKERGVKASFIRSLEPKASPRSRSRGARDMDSEAEGFTRGDKVEARFGGKSRYYKGEIVRANRDGTYDIDYVDGDKERGVKASFIRSLEPKSSSRSRSRGARDMESEAEGFTRGDKVEARFGGKSRYYKGEIVRANRDGTYDIDYVDGDKERGVKASLIRSLEPKSSPRSKSRGARDMDSEAEGFSRGDQVEARFGGKSRYYKGEIVRANRDGTYDIDYVDGDKERGVKASFIRSLEPKSSSRSRSRGARDMESEAEGFTRGDKVEARFGGKSRYYKGEIVRANRDGTYDIDYVDGDKERGVKASLIRSLEPKSSPRSKSRGARDMHSEAEGFSRGDQVEARFGGKSRYYKGEIVRANRDGTYDIDYVDGDKERGVKASFIRPLEPKSSPRSRSRGARNMDSEPEEFSRGDKVEARFGGKSRFYKGEIVRVNRDGTYDIDYVDGDKERGVKASFIRSLEPKSSSRSKSRGARDMDSEPEGFSRGDQVEARFGGKSRYYKGEIVRVNRDGTYDIDYVDGDKERGVQASFIRSLEPKSSPRSRSRGARDMESEAEGFTRGDKVEARFGGKSRYYKGEIVRVNRDGTYDIDYVDGDKERGVQASFIRSLEPKSSPRSRSRGARDMDSEAEGFSRGDQVEARFGGKSRYYKGEIVRVNRDGTYDIDYVDGDKERGVQASFIRPLEPKSSPRSRSRGARDMDSEAEGFARGDQVEARFGGKSRYYKGEIVRVNRDGTYDIDYVDGDKERGVQASLIRSLEPKSSPRSKSRGVRDMDSEAEGFTRGDKVEARFGGKSRYYKGEIVRANRDGTYDIDYVDGDKERGVKASFIRSLEPKSSPRSRSRGARDMDSEAEGFARGDQVEARFGGKSRYYKGEIVRVNRDGTYDIDYVDGDKERGVQASFIRSLEPKSSPRSKSRGVRDMDSEAEGFTRGDKVEARFGGKSRYYKGEIVRANRDGTYDIDYVDGDKERGVKASFIRSLEPKSSPRSRSRGARDMDSEAEGFARGDQVEARFGGKSRYYKGEIVRVNRDGTYDIDYVDGDKERGVKASLIRSLEPKSSPRSKSRGARDMHSEAEGFSRGDQVEARFGGKSRYYKGEIVRANRDGTYDIDYVDGDKERGVKASFIRPLEPKATGSHRGERQRRFGINAGTSDPESFVRGDRVEARFGGKSRYYKGEISRVNRDGTYSIDYVDGDRETSVSGALIRLIQSPRGTTQRRGVIESESESEERFSRGTLVEARYKGGRSYYRGRIARVHGNGQYDINYDDGDEERNVPEGSIRPVSTSTSARSTSHRRVNGSDSDAISDGEYMRIEYLFKKESRVTLNNVDVLLRRLSGSPIETPQRRIIQSFARNHDLGPRDEFDLNLFKKLCVELGVAGSRRH